MQHPSFFYPEPFISNQKSIFSQYKQNLTYFKENKESLSSFESSSNFLTSILKISSNFFLSLPLDSQKKNKKLKANLMAGLRLIEKDLLIEIIETKNKEGAFFSDFYFLLSFFALDNDLGRLKNLVKNKVREEVLIDRAQLQSKGFKFKEWMLNAFDQSDFEEFFVPSFLNLLKRSENNVVTLQEIVENNVFFRFDTSKSCEKIIFEGLSEIFLGKNSDRAVKVAISFVKNVESFDVLCKILRQIETLSQSILNEGHKMAIIKILEGFIFKLQNLIDESSKNSIYSKILNILVPSFQFVTNEESLPIFTNIFNLLSKAFQPIRIEANIFQALKKTLTTSKLGVNCVILLISSVFLSNEKLFENEKEIFNLVDIVLNQVILAQLKQPNKLVSGYSIFLNAMNMIGNVIGTTLESRVKLEKVYSGFFSETIYFNQSKFIMKGNTNDLNLLLTICLSYCKFLAYKPEVQIEKPLLFANTLIQTIMEPNITCHFLQSLIKNLDSPTLMHLSSHFIVGMFSKMLTTPIFEEKEKQKLFLFLKITLQNTPDVTSFDPLILLPFFYLDKRLSPYFIRKVRENKDFCEKLASKVLEIFAFHFSYGKKLSFFSKSWVQGFIDLDLTHHLFDKISSLLDLKDLEEKEIIDQFEEEFTKENKGDFTQFIEELTQISYSVNFSFLEEFLPKIKEKEKNKKPISKGVHKKTKEKSNENHNQIKEKVEFLDEEGMILLQKEQTFLKFINLTQKISDLLIFLANSGAEDYFLSEILVKVLDLAQREEFRSLLHDLCVNFFRKNKDFLNHSSLLTEILIKQSMYQGITNTTSLEKLLLSFLNLLKRKEFSQSFLEFFLDLSIYILGFQDYEPQIKGSALKIISILSEKIVLKSKMNFLFEAILKNINISARFEKITIALLRLLIQIIDQSLIPNIFDHLLQVSAKAKEVLLKTVLSESNSLSLKPSFPIYAKLKVLDLEDNSFAKSLLESKIFCDFKPDSSEIENFNFSNFLSENSKDSNDHFCVFLYSLMKEENSLIKIIFEAFLKAIEENIVKIPIEEEGFLIFPQFLKINIEIIPADKISKIFHLIIDNFCQDDNPILLEQVLKIGEEIIIFYGSQENKILFSVLESYIVQNEVNSSKKVYALTFLGFLSKYLSNGKELYVLSNKILEVILEAETILQPKLSACLAELLVFFENPELIIQEKCKNCLNESTRTRQRGCAFIVAGLIKGMGANTIEKLEIFKFIKTTIDSNTKKDKDKDTIKEGILYLLQALIDGVGILIEPYMKELLEIAMSFFGENNENLRTLSFEITRKAMGKLSCFGIHTILPLLLKGLDEKANWRTKLASIYALGNMAYCSPKQLSGCLPQIIPCLSITLADIHPTIREEASEALQVIGRIIKNPEVANNIDILIKSISNPFDENKHGLEVLLKTQFHHYIDFPSLSLIIPIVEYGLKSRESILKEKAAQLIGAITILINDVKFILPYVESLTNSLKIAICDPISDVRNISAKALGSLASKVGEANSEKIIIVLKEILENPDTKSSDRAGAAQAYSEVLWALGPEYFEKNKDICLKLTTDEKTYIKESYIGLFIYLPGIMEDELGNYLNEVLEHLLESLADENENIRGLTLRALRILVEKYGYNKTDLLLIPINEGLFCPNNRKRNSAIILAGDLIRIISKPLKNEKKPIFEELLASIYILRQDQYENARNCAENIWKEGVPNKPKTLKQILPILIKKLISLANLQNGIERLVEATIKEYSLKYSESYFRDLFEILHNNIENEAELQMGSFQVLNVLLNETSSQFLHLYESVLENFFKKYMVNNDDSLRKIVFSCFRSLLEKLNDIKIVINLIEFFENCLQTLVLKDMNNIGYETYLQVFEEFIELKSPQIIEFLKQKLSEEPPSQYKMDIRTKYHSILGQNFGDFDSPEKESLLKE